MYFRDPTPWVAGGVQNGFGHANQKSKGMQHSRVRCICGRNEEYNNGLKVVWDYDPVGARGVQYGY